MQNRPAREPPSPGHVDPPSPTTLRLRAQSFSRHRARRPDGAATMKRLSRRQVLGGAVAATGAVALGAPAVHAQKGRRTLRFVAQADLKILDPIWTTAYITRNHGYLVYDTLFGTDEQLQIKPQMVDRSTVSADGMKYTFTLRDRLRWHDGQPVRAEDCVESLKRWGKRDRFGRLLMAHTGKIAARRPEDVHARARRALRPRARRAGQAIEQRALHDAGADRGHLCRTSRSRKSWARDRSSSRGTSGNRATRSCTCGTPTTSRATRSRAARRAARRRTSTK